MKFIFFFFGFSFFVSTSYGQIILSPKEQNFGIVKPGNHYSCRFKVTNFGKTAVTVSNLFLNSDRLTGKIEKNKIQPNGDTWIAVDFSPGEDRRGPVSIAVGVATSRIEKNGIKKYSESQVLIRAQVEPDFSFYPPVLLGTCFVGKKPGTLQGEVVLSSALKDKGSSWKSGGEINGISVKMQPVANKGNLPVTIQFSKQKMGILKGKIRIVSTAPGGPIIEYPYHVEVKSRYEFEPRALRIPTIEKISDLSKLDLRTQVRRIDGKSIDKLTLKDAPPWLSMALAKGPKDLSAEISWKLDKEKLFSKESPADKFKSIVAFETAFEEEPIIYLPISLPDDAYYQKIRENRKKFEAQSESKNGHEPNLTVHPYGERTPVSSRN